MKKGIITLIIMVVTVLTIPIVKAETILQTIQNSNTNPLTNETKELINTTIINEKGNYEYYQVYTQEEVDQGQNINIVFFDQLGGIEMSINSYLYISNYFNEGKLCDITNGVVSCNTFESATSGAIMNGRVGNVYYRLYDSNYNLKNTDAEIELQGFYNDNIVINEGDYFPLLKNLYEFESWADYESNYNGNYTEINLDNYEYVLLSLKNYNQTNAFQTNLQVKGQIGITPIYNYGQTSKDAVTGSQVQDRCNLSYSEYTNYPFYIIQSDIQNNAIYAVKECSSGSSFKFDNTVFDVTYVTAENKNNPTVTINGKTYDVIPYSDLPSTATKNEEDNYIPGQSGSATDTGGLDSAIKKAQQKMGEIWNTFTYFTDFINQIFSVFPDEVKTILLSAFTIMIVIGLIKIFIGK